MKGKGKVFLALAGLAVVGGAHCLVAATTKFPAPETPTDQITESQNSPTRKMVKFSAVAKGQQFEQQIGDNLFFRLIPHELGWMISVGSKTSTANNFSGVVTPPYRGINPIYIDGWYFRNSDNTEPNDAGPKNVNAPQEIREFCFVLNDADYQKAFDALQKLLWSYSYSNKEVKEAREFHENLSKGRGTLTIRDLKLRNLETGNQAGIDFMEFDAEFKLP